MRLVPGGDIEDWNGWPDEPLDTRAMAPAATRRSTRVPGLYPVTEKAMTSILGPRLRTTSFCRLKPTTWPSGE